MQPTDDMAAPLRVLARFMATGDDAGLRDAFASDGLVIFENFAPFVFQGPGAFERWRDGFRRHATAGDLTELQHSFGPAQDVSLDDDTAYFVLPTTWTGRAHGRPFSEDGGWAFVLVRDQGRWRIRSYAWAVTAKR